MNANGSMNYLRATFLKEVCEEVIATKNPKFSNFKNMQSQEAYEIASDLVMQYLYSFALNVSFKTIEIESKNAIQFSSRANRIDDLEFDEYRDADAPIQVLVQFYQEHRQQIEENQKKKAKIQQKSSKSKQEPNNQKQMKVQPPKDPPKQISLPKVPPVQKPMKKPSRFTDESTTEDSINISEQFPMNALKDPRPVPMNIKPGGPPPHIRKPSSYSEDSSLDLSGI